MNKTKKRGGASMNKITPSHELDLAYRIKDQLLKLNGNGAPLISRLETQQYLIDIYKILGLLSVHYKFIKFDTIQGVTRNEFEKLEKLYANANK